MFIGATVIPPSPYAIAISHDYVRLFYPELKQTDTLIPVFPIPGTGLFEQVHVFRSSMEDKAMLSSTLKMLLEYPEEQKETESHIWLNLPAGPSLTDVIPGELGPIPFDSKPVAQAPAKKKECNHCGAPVQYGHHTCPWCNSAY